MGEFDRAVALTEERIDLGDGGPSQQALQWERLARYRWERGDGPGARLAYEKSAELLPKEAAPEVRAKVLSGYAWFLGATFELDQAKMLSDEARSASAGANDPSVRWQALLSWGVARLGEEAGHRALLEARDVAIGLDAGTTRSCPTSG